MYSNLMDYFPQFNGPQKDVISARAFILKLFLKTPFYTENIESLFNFTKNDMRFLQMCKKSNYIRSNSMSDKFKPNIYNHFTCAIDIKNVRFVYKQFQVDVIDSILNQNLMEYDLL